jgi:hypothetical protein
LKENVFWMRVRLRKVHGRNGITVSIRKVAQGESLMMKVGAAAVDVAEVCAVADEARAVAAAAALRVAEDGEREELAAVVARGSLRGNLAIREREY